MGGLGMGEYEEIDLLIKTGKNIEALELLRDIKKQRHYQ